MKSIFKKKFFSVITIFSIIPIYSIIIIVSIFTIACGTKSENAQAEKYLLGKWNTELFSFEFKDNGEMIINDNNETVNMKYYLTYQSGKNTLNMISLAGDTAKIVIDSISKNYLRLYPEKNPSDIKIFTK